MRPLPLLRLFARLILAATFIAAALPKILDPVAFAMAIDGYQVLDQVYLSYAALVLPWLELVVAFGLFIPFFARASSLTISALLVLFIALHASAWARGLDISCGCFGTSTLDTDGPNYLLLIGRNSLLLLAAVWLLIYDFRNFARSRLP